MTEERIIYAGFPGEKEAQKAGMKMNWIVYPATDVGMKQLIKDGYMAVSLYEFSEPVEKGKPRPTVYGDLTLDFDAKKESRDALGNYVKIGDIATSLEAVRKFVRLLITDFEVNPNALKYWASGGKGFHVEIPREIIGSEDGDTRLPEIYGHMIFIILNKQEYWWNDNEGNVHKALHDLSSIKLEDYCIDSGSFKSGKGQLIRLPHIQRADGNYKVPVTYDEIMFKDSWFFEGLVKQDRMLDFENTKAELLLNKKLEKLYREAKDLIYTPFSHHNGSAILETLESSCEFIKFCRDKPELVNEPKWFLLARVLGKLGKAGINAFMEYSKRDRSRFNFAEALVKMKHSWNYPFPICREINQEFSCQKNCKVKTPIDLHYKQVKNIVQVENFKIVDDQLVYIENINNPDNKIVICSKIEIVALARDASNSCWSKIIEVVDYDNILHECIIPNYAFQGQCEKAIEILVNVGLQLEPGTAPRKKLQEFLCIYTPKERGRICDKYGWVDDKFDKYLPFDLGRQEDGSDYLCMRDDFIINKVDYQKGTLEEWQEHIGKFCKNNPFLQLACIIAISGPLLNLFSIQGFGVHLFGKSSSGKTTALEIASSVNGMAVKTWRATDNGLEGVASMSNDNTLLLDEIGQCDPDAVANVAYMLSNGQAKMRADRTGKHRMNYTWNLLYLSNGELSMAERINQSFKNKSMAGHEVRTINLHADANAGIGIFSELPPGMTANEFANHLKNITKKYRGAPFAAMLSLIKQDKKKIINNVSKAMSEFMELYAGMELDGQRLRVARNLAFLAGGGEAAIQGNIFPWRFGDALNAIKFCFDKWLDGRQGNVDLETEKAMDKLKTLARNNFYGRNGEERGIREYEHKGNNYYFVPRDYVIPEVCAAYRYQDLIAALDKENLLLRDRNNKPQEQPWFGNGEDRKRGICLSKKGLYGEVESSQCESCDFNEVELSVGNLF